MLAVITIYFSKNNIFFVLSCAHTNNIIFAFSPAGLGFKNFKKSLNFLLQTVCFKIKQTAFMFFILKLKGLNKFKNLLTKRFIKQNIDIIKVIDLNKNPYNGCRSSALRRV
jgi:ribosomal protein S11